MKTYLTTLLIIAWILLSTPALAHDEIKTHNLSTEQKELVEKRLWVFFNQVEKYSIERQKQIYTILDERLKKYDGRYAANTVNYSIIDILTEAVEHKQSDITASAEDILSHVIYGTDYHEVEKIETPTEPSDNNVDQEDASEDMSETEEQNENEVIYRSDLDTDDLNEFDKDILAGTSAGVMSLRVRANLEPIETERVEVTFNQDIDNIGMRWNLYHDWVLVGQASASDVNDNVMIFDNMTDLTIWETTSYLQLEIITETIWEDYIGQARNNISVTRVSLQENKWTITWDDVWGRTFRETSRAFSIVPVKITVNLESEFGKNISTSRVKIMADVNENNDNGNRLSGRLTGVILQISGFKRAGDISILNWNGVSIGEANITWSWEVTISLTPDSISSRGESYEIVTNTEALFRIPQDWIIYSDGNQTFTSNLDSQIFLGQR